MFKLKIRSSLDQSHIISMGVQLAAGFASVGAIQTESRDSPGKVISEVGLNIYFATLNIQVASVI